MLVVETLLLLIVIKHLMISLSCTQLTLPTRPLQVDRLVVEFQVLSKT